MHLGSVPYKPVIVGYNAKNIQYIRFILLKYSLGSISNFLIFNLLTCLILIRSQLSPIKCNQNAVNQNLLVPIASAHRKAILPHHSKAPTDLIYSPNNRTLKLLQLILSMPCHGIANKDGI